MRAIVRGDLDGIISAALLRLVKEVDEVLIVDLKEYLDGKIQVTDQDILCNLPYNPNCYLWFDHHSSEARRTSLIPSNFQGAYSLAPSAARVVYDYFLPFHPNLELHNRMVLWADKVDSADLSKEDVLEPTGMILLGFLLDPRSRMATDPASIERYDSWRQNIAKIIAQQSIDDILADSETQHWVDLYRKNQQAAIMVFLESSHIEEGVLFSDFRGVKVPPANRFIIYSLPLFAEANISVQISEGEPDVWYEISVGHSIFNRTSMVDVGDLCSWYGGGGHRTVGVCRPSAEDVDQVLQEILHSCREPVSSTA